MPTITSGSSLLGGAFWSPKATILAASKSKPTTIHDINFLTDKLIPSWMQFSRLSAATYFDNGVLKDAAIDQPRFEADGLLVEKQSTNTVINSNAASSATPYLATITRTVDSISAFGITPGNRIKSTKDSSNNISLRAFVTLGTPANGLRVSSQMLLKNNNSINLEMGSNQGGLSQIVLPNASMHLQFENILGNGAGIVQHQFRTALNTEIDATWAWVQYEVSSYCSSIIKTFGTAVTRSQENLTIPASNQSILIKYKRQDNDVIEKQIIDAASNYNLNLSVGCHLQRVKVFNRILTNAEKTVELANV